MNQPSKLDKKKVEDICGLSPLQEGLLYHYLKDPDDTAYTIRLVISFNERIDPTACEAAWQTVILNNEILRTVFRWEGIRLPIQIVLKDNNFILWHQELQVDDFSLNIRNYLEISIPFQLSLMESPFHVALYTVGLAQSYLVIRHHHILYDGWSTGILVNEFLQTYNQITTKSLSQSFVKPSVKSFTEAIKKSFTQQGKIFWSDYLQGYSPVEEIKFSRPIIVEKFSYNEYSSILPLDVTEKVAAYAKQSGVTLAAILYTAWGLLLLKRSGLEDVIFGTTVSGRSLQLRNVEHAVGLFINTLPLRIKSQEYDSVEYIILQLSNHLQERENFANYPLVEIKQLALGKSEKELFSTLVVIENYPLDTAKMLASTELKVNDFAIKENTHYNLTLSIRLFDKPELYFNYNLLQWSPAAIVRLQEQFINILFTIVDNPRITYNELDIISTEEKSLLLGKFDDTFVYSTTDTLVSLFEKQVLLTPEHIAIRFGRTILNYQQVQQSVFCVAVWLQTAYSIVPGDRIGILRDKDEYLVPLLMGILKAGATYIPIDTKYQIEDINTIVQSANLKLIISGVAYYQLASQVVTTVVIEDQWQVVSQLTQPPVAYAVDVDSLACILYTLDEKGRCDGMPISYQAITNYLTWMQKEYALVHSDVVLQKAPLSSSASIWELFWWSFTGASLCLMDSGAGNSPKEIIEYIVENNITTLNLEPSLCSLWLGEFNTDIKLQLQNSIRRIYINATRMTWEQVQAFRKIVAGNSRLISLYQPTGTALPVASHEYKKESQLTYIPIGKPVSNNRLYVLGSQQQLLPVCTIGELYISELLTSSDYRYGELHSKPALATNSFLEGQLIYPTGNWVQWQEDGSIAYLGNKVTDNRQHAANTTEAIGTIQVLPSNEIEHKLVAIWAEVLHLPVDSISIISNFFELGGHSLKAFIVLNKIIKVFNKRIPYKLFYENSSIKNIAVLVSGLEKNDNITIQKAEVKEYYPLSSAQRRLYFLRALNEKSIAYNMSYAVRIKGLLDTERMSDAFIKLINRHEALRTYFKEVDEEPMQWVDKEIYLNISYHSLSTAEADNAIANFRQPFDIRVAPLFRVGVIEISSEEYILMIDMHHIIADGISRNIFIKDFISFYNKQIPSPLWLQYKDYAVWQNDQLLQKLNEKQRQFWLKEFANIPPIPELPIDFHRPDIKGDEGDTLSFNLGEQETRLLRKMTEEEGVTMFALLLSIYNIFLSKLTGLEDLVVGTPVAARQHTDFEEIVGMFVNTLPLRNQLDGKLRFRDLLQTVNQKVIACLENQEYPYEELINELSIERNTSHNPLFDVLFVYENAYFSQLEIPGLELSELTNRHRTSKFDLTLTVSESSAELVLDFEYSTALFKKATIERFCLYFINIINSVINYDNKSISQIQIMPKAEEKAILQKLDNTNVDYPASATVTELFEKQAKLTPHSVALKWAERTLTYGALLKQVNLLAVHLRHNGVAVNTIVALLMDRSMDTVIGMLAILKAGGAYLPVDIDYPEERIQYMIADSAANFILTAKRFENQRGGAVPVLYIEDIGNVTTPAPDLLISNQPEDLCYVIYTSGTTGSPKGVMIEHRNVVRLFFNDQFQFNFSSSDTWTMLHSHCFDFSVWEIYGALLFGGKLIIIPKAVARDTSRYLQMLAEEQVTVLNQTPSAFYSLAQEGMDIPHLPLSLRYVIFGGEALNPSKLKAWHKLYPDVELINMFGITETTVHVTYKKILPDDIEVSVSNIGKPIPTLSVYVCDKYQQLVAPGVAGELLVGGKGLARGYINKPELTKEKFIPHFFLPGERLYRSGDLAKLLSNGDIVYLGRIDEQVKIRGHRIELGEVENSIRAYSGVQEAVVVVKERGGDKYLAAYYVSDKHIPAIDLKQFLSSKLPEYMLPIRYMRIDNMPLTSNNKLDGKALPEYELQEVEKVYRPNNQLQKDLVTIWAEVLEVPENKVGLTTNFFDLGGNSLLLVKMVNKVNRCFENGITVAEAFAYPTILGLAELLSRNGSSTNDEVVPHMLADLEQMSDTIDLFNKLQD